MNIAAKGSVTSEMTRWLVDGMNVIGSRPDGWWRDRKRAVVEFVDHLDAWASATGEPVTVVFDGDRPPQLPDEDRAMDVVFVGRGKTADDEIARRVAGDPDPESLLVVTSDGELIRRVAPARVLGAGAFRRRLDTVPSAASPPRPAPVSARELVVLGTASQAPTRYRNHNGYLLRWDTEGLLFDPGEGTQRQLLLAGVASSAVTRICVTHFHGDHCLGLPGVLQRLSLDRVAHPVAAYYPASGQMFFERLRTCALYDDAVSVAPRPLTGPGVIDPGPTPFRLEAARLDHRAETYGYRLVEPDGRRMLPKCLAAAGVAGPDIGRLQREGVLALPGGGRVTLEEMSEHRRGQRFAFVMDTRLCDAAFALAEGADLLVCESTYLGADAGLAADHGHLTAAQAARIAAESGARRLVLTHFSQRYPDPAAFAAEAGEVFPEVVVAADLDRIDVPARH